MPCEKGKDCCSAKKEKQQIPESMRALIYSSPRNFSVENVPVPEYDENEVLVKIQYGGICGTDQHLHDGEFGAKFPLCPGHEGVGHVAAFGKNVKDFQIGDLVAADICFPCGGCFYCRKDKARNCTHFDAKGVTMPGAFAEYIVHSKDKLYKVKNLSAKDATLLEPAACAVSGLDRLKEKGAPVGAEILIIGAGPTGLLLASLLKNLGYSKLTIASNKGPKMDWAKKHNVADEYVELDRANKEVAAKQWQQLKEANPNGFDIVIEASGVSSLAEKAFDYARRGGQILMYGVYPEGDFIKVNPYNIFRNEWTIHGSFSHVNCFARAVQLLDSGKIDVSGMVTHTFDLEQYQEALDTMNGRTALKIAVKI